ncbi:unnamed protein product, partial [Ixodes persulcatus]
MKSGNLTPTEPKLDSSPRSHRTKTLTASALMLPDSRLQPDKSDDFKSSTRASPERTSRGSKKTTELGDKMALQLHQQWRLPQPPPDVPSGQGEASDGWPRDQPRFVLAPTPAQLGRAPGQLNPRKSSTESSRTADLSDESSRAPLAPQAREDPPPEAPDLREEAGSCGPPSAREVRKSILKRTVDDGMDRVLEEVNFNAQFAKLPEFKPEESPSGATSLPSSPFVQTYRKRPKATGLEVEECEASSPGGRMPKGSPVGTPRTPKTGSKLEGTTFFGPSFSLDALVDVGARN